MGTATPPKKAAAPPRPEVDPSLKKELAFLPVLFTQASSCLLHLPRYVWEHLRSLKTLCSHPCLGSPGVSFLLQVMSRLGLGPGPAALGYHGEIQTLQPGRWSLLRCHSYTLTSCMDRLGLSTQVSVYSFVPQCTYLSPFNLTGLGQAGAQSHLGKAWFKIQILGPHPQAFTFGGPRICIVNKCWG